jgi:GcrA cell cycle regulator
MEPDPIAFDNVVPMSQRLSLLELNEATCHWPVGDPSSPEFFFCGGKALAGLPYCAHHSRVAYQPAADRRRQQPKPTR